MGFKVKLFLFVLILIVGFIGFANAQPPFQQPSQQSPSEAGYLIIETGWAQTHQLNEDLFIHAHVYNGTTGKPITSGINCSYHTYNHQINGGEHIDIGTLTQYEAGYYNYTNGSLLNETGQYSVLLWCEGDAEGGFLKYSFDVTYTGKQISTAQGLLYVPLFTLLVLFFVITLLGISQLPSSNQRDEEGRILSITYLKYLRAPLWVLEYMLIVAMLYLSSNLAFAYLNEHLFAQILFTLFQISFGVTPIMVIVWMGWIYVSLFHDKQFQDMLNKGIFPEGKL